MKTGRTLENINLVLQSLEENGQRSSRRNGLGLSRCTFNRIVKIDLKFHPYVLIRRQALKQGDPAHAQRLTFCIDLLKQLREILVFLINK